LICWKLRFNLNLIILKVVDMTIDVFERRTPRDINQKLYWKSIISTIEDL
jgi:hypothetical protein